MEERPDLLFRSADPGILPSHRDTLIVTANASLCAVVLTFIESLVAGAPWGFGSAGLRHQLVAVKVVEWPIHTPYVDTVLVSFEGQRSFGKLLHSSFYASEMVNDHFRSWIVGVHCPRPASEDVVAEKLPPLLGKRRQWLYAIGVLIGSRLLRDLLLKLL